MSLRSDAVAPEQRTELRPLISIALCTYNGAAFLREQLDSLIAQTTSDFEIVAVDDCSTDETPEILAQYQKRDPRLRVERNLTNLGFRKNFERALLLARGSLIAPCDQDDIWLPDKLEKLLRAIGEHALAYCDSEFIDELGEPLHKAMSDTMILLSTLDPVPFAAGNCVSGHAMLFRRALLEHALPVPDCFYYDWWLAAVAANAGGVIHCGEKLVKYRLHDRNVTNVLRSRPAKRARGYRWTQLRDFRRRLEYLARLPGNDRAFIQRWLELWAARERQWVSFGLAMFIYRHAPRIFALKKPSRSPLRHALKYVLGMRWKRLVRPYAYGEEAPDP